MLAFFIVIYLYGTMLKSHYVFRYIQPADIEPLTAIINKAYRPKPGQEGWTHESDWITEDRISVEQLSQEAQRAGQHIVVATLNNRLLGCVMFGRHQHRVEIGLLTVDPEVQTQHLGQQLLAHAEALAGQLYQPDYFEMSVVNTRTELMAYYQRRGYQLTGNSKAYPIAQQVGTPKVPLHLLIMQKSANK